VKETPLTLTSICRAQSPSASRNETCAFTPAHGRQMMSAPEKSSVNFLKSSARDADGPTPAVHDATRIPLLGGEAPERGKRRVFVEDHDRSIAGLLLLILHTDTHPNWRCIRLQFLRLISLQPTVRAWQSYVSRTVAKEAAAFSKRRTRSHSNLYTGRLMTSHRYPLLLGVDIDTVAGRIGSHSFFFVYSLLACDLSDHGEVALAPTAGRIYHRITSRGTRPHGHGRDPH